MVSGHFYCWVAGSFNMRLFCGLGRAGPRAWTYFLRAGPDPGLIEPCGPGSGRVCTSAAGSGQAWTSNHNLDVRPVQGLVVHIHQNRHEHNVPFRCCPYATPILVKPPHCEVPTPREPVVFTWCHDDCQVEQLSQLRLS